MASDVTVMLEGDPSWSRVRNIGHYGGALDKANSETEGRVPYAWAFYRELRAARGSAYRTVYEGTTQGLVHAENLAAARSEAARWRASDKLANNALPLTSDERLGSWVETLGVETYPGDTIHDLRLRCAAKYQAGLGPTARVVDDAVQQLLGAAFVRTWRNAGTPVLDAFGFYGAEGTTITDLASPPTPTFWPTINPGPAAFDLGGGTWLSSRSFYIVEVQQPDNMPLTTYLELLNVHLFNLLDRILPAWASFGWAEGLSAGGFVLDLSDLDFDGMI
jgi:hypothetical protein